MDENRSEIVESFRSFSTWVYPYTADSNLTGKLNLQEDTNRVYRSSVY